MISDFLANPLPAAGGAELVRERASLDYTDAERQFSTFVQRKMYRLLKGTDNDFLLMRRYYESRPQVAFFMPSRLEKARIRPAMAEGILFGVLQFLNPFAPGGPIAQEMNGEHLTETQAFPTQYPHIVVERTDVFTKAARQSMYIEWRAVRLQNQRQSTLVNRALDMGNLALEISKFVRFP